MRADVPGTRRLLSEPGGRLSGMDDELTDLERSILEFERQWWKYPGAKETAIRERFDMSSTRYYQVVNALIDRPAALTYDPLLVHRLIRLRAARAAQRSAARAGCDVSR